MEFDVLFGPAYKGITLAAAVAIAYADMYGVDTPFAYNRKEAKDHGEGGVLVGADMTGKRYVTNKLTQPCTPANNFVSCVPCVHQGAHSRRRYHCWYCHP